MASFASGWGLIKLLLALRPLLFVFLMFLLGLPVPIGESTYESDEDMGAALRPLWDNSVTVLSSCTGPGERVTGSYVPWPPGSALGFSILSSSFFSRYHHQVPPSMTSIVPA